MTQEPNADWLKGPKNKAPTHPSASGPEVTDLKAAHKIAQSDGGPRLDRTQAAKNKRSDPAKIENDLELAKANKRKTPTVQHVAGREKKGSMTGFLEKLLPDGKGPKEKGPGGAKEIKVARTGRAK